MDGIRQTESEFDELARAAMKEVKPESTMPYDLLAWYRLRDVYRDFKAGKISKDEGEGRKRNIFQDRQKEVDYYESRFLMDKHFADFWWKIEEAGTAYCKAPTIDNADRFVRAVYGAGRLARKAQEQSEVGVLTEQKAQERSEVGVLAEKEKPVTENGNGYDGMTL